MERLFTNLWPLIGHWSLTLGSHWSLPPCLSIVVVFSVLFSICRVTTLAHTEVSLSLCSRISLAKRGPGPARTRGHPPPPAPRPLPIINLITKISWVFV